MKFGLFKKIVNSLEISDDSPVIVVFLKRGKSKSKRYPLKVIWREDNTAEIVCSET